MDRKEEILLHKLGLGCSIFAIENGNQKEEVHDAMEQYAKEFVVWLSENTTIVTDYPNITLYRYHNRYDGWGNYTLDDIYTVFTEEINK